MKPVVLPPGDARSSDEIVSSLRARARAFVPELGLDEPGVESALAGVFARYARAVLIRLNRAPEKNRLAFYRLLGVEPTPARAARAVLVFRLNDKASASSAPAGTPVSAPPAPGTSEQIVFETEQSVGIAPGRLVQVVSLWPGRDAFIDHSAAVAQGSPFRAFASDDLQPVEHVVYLAHDKLLALSGSTRLSLEWHVAVPGSEPLDIQWEYWDGKVWREFLELNPLCLPEGSTLPDSTAGLSRSGRIELRADGAKSEKLAINGLQTHWLRGRSLRPISPDPSRQLPEVDAVRISSSVEQPLTASLQWSALPVNEGWPAIQLRNEAGLPLGSASIGLRFGSSSDIEELTEAHGYPGWFGLPQNRSFTDLTELRVTYFGVSGSLSFTVGKHLLNAKIALEVGVTLRGLEPDQAVGEAGKLDTTKPFHPFGQQPQPGAAFYLNCDEAFSKPGGNLRVYLPLTTAPLGEIASNDPGSRRTQLTAQIAWEYWNGRRWAVLLPMPGSTAKRDLQRTEILDFVIPSDFEKTKINDVEASWIRARLIAGGFGYRQEVRWTAGSGSENTIAYVVHQPPIAAGLKLAYSWSYGPFHFDRVLTYNDFRFRDHTDAARWPGSSFAPFERVQDATAALYLGFDKRPPADALGLYFDIEEQPGADPPPELTWEYWNGTSWQRVSVEDETQHLRFPAIATYLSQSDSAELDRFGPALYWLRLRVREDAEPTEIALSGVFPNAVWASQQRSFRDLALGQGDGSLNQVLHVAQVPILPGERIEVRELFGPRANVEWRLIALELFGGDPTVVQSIEDELAAEGTQTDVVRGPLRLRRDRLKLVNEVWVNWKALQTLLGAAPDERCYAPDRARGRLAFGDGRHGRVLPEGAAVQARFLQSGGGKAGNVAAGALAQLQSGVPGVEAVSNPRSAEGGADGESLEVLSARAPSTVRHRGRAVTASDYSTLAREASSTIAFARAIPTHASNGRTLSGRVTVIVIPHGQEPRPFPSVHLRQQVERYLRERAPAGIAAGDWITVTGPNYLPVDVSATIAPVERSQAGQVERAARAALEGFFHPIYGGPRGGWNLGRAVFLSDVAAVLERVPGLDYTKELALLSKGAPQGSRFDVAADRIVVAGSIRLKVQS